MIHVYLPLNDLLKFRSSKNVFKRLKSKLTITLQVKKLRKPKRSGNKNMVGI